MRNRLLTGTLPVVVLLLGQPARALPGSHAPAISTYDTRASSVVLAYRHGSSDAGPFNSFSYNANFSSTSGILSAQFGLHYVNFASKDNNTTAHGVGASGVALFVFPVAGRYDDGVPKAAIAFDVGAVPTAYVSGERNFLTMPLVLGIGVPLSPHKAVTFTPWFEIAPSANLDTVFKPEGIQLGSNVVTPSPECSSTDPATQQKCQFSLNQSAIEDAVKKGVTVDLSFKVPMRAGLDAAIHLGDAADLNVYSGISTLGGGFTGSSVITLGAGLTFRWDDIVPAVLPVGRRLEREGCEAIEGRFRSCPGSRKWLAPEQRAQPLAVSPNATQLTPAQTSTTHPASAPPKPMPAPLAPAPLKPVATPPAPIMPAPTTTPTPPSPPSGSEPPLGFTPTPGPGSPASAAFPN